MTIPIGLPEQDITKTTALLTRERTWARVKATALAMLDAANAQAVLTALGVTATVAELNETDLSAATQAITEAGAITLSARHVTLVGPAASTYAVTLAAPDKAGRVMVIEMLSTTATNAVTLALTNVVGGSAATSASFDAAGEILVLVSASLKWVVLKERGVTLS